MIKTIYGYGFTLIDNSHRFSEFNSMDIKASGYPTLDFAIKNAKAKIDELLDGTKFSEIRI